MREVKKGSPAPLYGAAAVWALYCLLFHPYRPIHFLIMIVLAVAAYFVMNKLFPGHTEYVEEPTEPVSTGNEEIDALLRQGDEAVAEMNKLKTVIKSDEVRTKITTIADLTDKIFKDLVNDPADLPQVRRFASYFLPTTLKFLNSYANMEAEGVAGQNISGTMTRIENILDTTVSAFQKQLDSLYANQALDIETDITVLEGMLNRDGFGGK